jgi:hypothetical protein
MMHSLKLDDLIAPGRQDLSYLGLQLVAYIYDEATETRVILCRGHDRLVSVTRHVYEHVHVLAVYR